MQFASLPRLQHDLVQLRLIEEADIEAWFRYLSQQEVYEHTSWNVQDSSELRHHVWNSDECTAASPVRFAIELRSHNELVGTAGFYSISPNDRRAEIAYDIDPRYWGRGIASAVCSELVSWAHSAAAITRVQATVLESNLRSAAVLRRCGFELEGLLQSYRSIRGKSGNFLMYSHVHSPAGA
jgi:[ribosomal protein S5]-alanine N-acetyltransferase